jgi:hypothetical protein
MSNAYVVMRVRRSRLGTARSAVPVAAFLLRTVAETWCDERNKRAHGAAYYVRRVLLEPVT